jgi:hypothetical protein
VKTAPRCLICSSPRRGEAEAWLARQGEPSEHGVLTLGVLAEKVLPLVLSKPISVSSIKRHLGKAGGLPHTELGGRGADSRAGAPVAAWLEDDELQAVIAEVDGLVAAERVSPSALLNLQQRLYLLDLKRRLARGESIAVTADAAARAAAQLQKSEYEEEQASLLRGLAGAAGAFVSRALAGQERPAIEPPIEGEAVEDVDGIESDDSQSVGEVSGGLCSAMKSPTGVPVSHSQNPS